MPAHIYLPECLLSCVHTDDRMTIVLPRAKFMIRLALQPHYKKKSGIQNAADANFC